MITCPWCGTTYIAFQSSCQKCGGPLLPPSEVGAPGSKPPAAPRPIAESFARRLMWTDGWAIASATFTLLGVIFTVLGLALTIFIVTAFVGIPFMLVGILGLGVGLPILVSRYQKAQKVVAVLRHGESVDGQIVSVEENTMVRVGLQHPRVVKYRFRLGERDYEGSVSTLNRVALKPGQTTCVLYLPQSPEYNALYPHP